MPTSSLRILASALMVALLAIISPAHAQQVAPRITIDSIPPGANVLVDGALQGQSGPNFKVRMNKGPHKIRLELDGHKPFEQTVQISNATKLTYPLEKAAARLDIKFPATNDAARGAEIFVDGTPAGVVPQLIDAPAGRHLIEVRKPGHKVFTETVETKAGVVSPVWVLMTTDVRLGSVLVAADATADVFVDGQPRGQAPMVVDQLTEGEHLVEVRRTEPGAPPWRQTVRVTGNQQTKVMAQTTPPPPAQGSLMVITSIPDAEILVDGASKGSAGSPINLAPGQHAVTVQAKGYKPISKVVDIEPGKPRVERIEMEGDATTRKVGIVRIIMTTPMEGAQYFVNGRRIDESAALSDQGVEVASGKVVVVVKKDGFGMTKQEITLPAGATETVTMELRNVGKVYIATEPRGAYVLLDKNLIGQTPLTRDNVGAGPHSLEFQLVGYENKTETLNVRPGEQENVNFILVPQKAPEIDKLALQKGLSSFSAVVNEPGHFTGDIGSGYPWFGNLRLTVGVWKTKNSSLGELGLDVGAEVRTNLYSDTNVGGNIRFQFLRKGPFAVGLNTYLGGGGGPRNRNTFSWELGLPITLLAGSMVKMTARPYLQVYSDRNCPSQEYLKEMFQKDRNGLIALGDPRDGAGAEHTGDRCVGRGYDKTTTLPNPIYDAVGYRPGQVDGVSTYNSNNPAYQVDGVGVLERFNGARFMLQAAVELAVSANLSLYAILEGAPFQKDRQLFTDKFNRLFPINETPVYGRLGLTFKF
jgi:hypothetical protein